ncbi:MAG: hypothetical protein R3B06_23990 [Kofleriaceae bacterium]
MTEYTDLDELLRTQLPAHDVDVARAAAVRAAALDELRHARPPARWAWRLEAGAMLTAGTAQLVWVVAMLFGGR